MHEEILMKMYFIRIYAIMTSLWQLCNWVRFTSPHPHPQPQEKSLGQTYNNIEISYIDRKGSKWPQIIIFKQIFHLWRILEMVSICSHAKCQTFS